MEPLNQMQMIGRCSTVRLSTVDTHLLGGEGGGGGGRGLPAPQDIYLSPNVCAPSWNHAMAYCISVSPTLSLLPLLI